MTEVVQLNQQGRRSPFLGFAEQLVAKYDAHLLNCGPEEQTAMVLRAMERLNGIAALTPVEDTEVDLAGFGKAPMLYTASYGNRAAEYLLLSDVAEALGWFMPRAHRFAEKMAGFDLEDQRREDEERGDGRLGWNRMRDYIRLDLELIIDDPKSKPDAGGRRMSDFSDWLVSRDRLPALLSASPWSKEFMDNTMPAFGYAMRAAWGDKLKNIPTVAADGTPTGGNAYDDLFSTDGLTEEEAQRRARRGPALDPNDDNL
ncbi:MULTISPECIES: hypothetical protein [unclassified Streptomyces]|uniref:hypothetical protein n=1 Tax=unclassified Streptomyces TaxID=2593676 RepID=UPI0011649F2F|nr:MULTISPECIES: hypothetical protein [unclassified Streptomyces]NMI57093.1 hypothetical protein [Streptomyces sp. RLA2-12]QDN56473.1 hypothetical protein FNV67_15265 [Streptomyces sp. S1D4-20]QDN66650.1 hypothetical protein FNV66_14860 [Streptomyces sp. S1D4-14]QDO49057.1 hypothetical protein FNV60_13110 [Streptomyces sp. RLB3-5]QDO59298.1 hypothetical protein FNV59_15355 [Streptomyces sp. RLB1-8]